ncbi:MAG: hypothetical protein EAX90_00900 [Candidatus Heimdallarchaeota archaeon]|nr:hypothetical protein [Candidatus Heimdallarchaeota archaeon]
MTLPKLVPLTLSTSNPKYVEKYQFNIKLAQLTGTNGPRDLYSAYAPDFFDKYSAAFAKSITEELVIGYDGSRIHESNSKSAREYMRRCGISIRELDGPVTVPEFMFSCYKLGLPGCFYGRSHSPQQYVGLKLVINGNNALDLLEKNGAKIFVEKNYSGEKIYGFLPRTLAPVIEEKIGKDKMVHPTEIGQKELISSKDMREEFFQSLKKVVPLKKIEGNFIVDCRHSMAGEVWKLIRSEFNGEIKLDNAILNPIAPDRDPREIWDQLSEEYYKQTQAVFSHDADADRTFLVKTPGIGKEKIIDNQEESFTTGLIAEAKERKPDAYILVQERISLLMLSSLKRFTDKVYATAQGEPAFFLGANELLFEKPELNQLSGADYTDIFYNKTHPICMKSPYQQALWMMYWFTDNEKIPEFPEVNVVNTQIDMLDLNYPQRLEKVLNSDKKIIDYFKKNFEIIYHSTLDGQNLILRDIKENMLITSIRPSGTGRYTKVITEVGLGKEESEGRIKIAQKVNKEIEKIIGE